MQTIQLKDIFKQVHQQTILKAITLTITPQSTIGIQMNHIEAVTLFDLLEGNQPQTAGKISGLTQNKVTALYAADGLYPQLTVTRYLKSFSQLNGFHGKLDPLLQQFALKDVAQARIKQLSFDQQQRLHLLRGLMTQPDLLLIENPLTNLTNAGIELYLAALNVVRSQNITVLLTSYSLEELVLTSQSIYRYHAATGLEATDLAHEPSVTGSATPVPAPKPILKIAGKVEGKTVFFSPNEIDFIESINGVSQLNVAGEQFASTQTMAVLERQLTNLGFFRCHRSYLVNLQQIAELISYSRNSYTLVLKHQNKLPLSRSKLADLKTLIDF